MFSQLYVHFFYSLSSSFVSFATFLGTNICSERWEQEKKEEWRQRQRIGIPKATASQFNFQNMCSHSDPDIALN